MNPSQDQKKECSIFRKKIYNALLIFYKNMTSLPLLFLKRLESIIPPDFFPQVEKNFSLPSRIVVRINTIKLTVDRALKTLAEKQIAFTPIPWLKEAVLLEKINPEELGQMDLIREGYLYRQALSSLLPSLILDPQSNDFILDLCAAPGSKTTQMAAQMQNQGSIIAIEPIRARYYKLKSVITQMGAENVSVKCLDGRRFRSADRLFDKILLDVPCSTEGRFKTYDAKSYAYWSPRKIKEMAHKQRGLLLSASRLLKPDGILVYSTCTFAPEENEAIVDWFLRKTPVPFQVMPIELPRINRYPCILKWGKKLFNPQIENCLRILPDEIMEAFFVAKLRRLS